MPLLSFLNRQGYKYILKVTNLRVKGSNNYGFSGFSINYESRQQ